MRRSIAILQALLLLFFWNVPLVNLAKADDIDIFGTNISPNVLILFDSSGSMDDSIPSYPYTASKTYNTPLTYNSTQVFRRFSTTSSCTPASVPCFKFYASTVATVNSAGAQTALSSVGYWSGNIGGSTIDLRLGNYLNYLACSGCVVQERKMDIAQRVVSNIVTHTSGVRFGVMKFSNNGSEGSGGGGMVGLIGTDPGILATAINNIGPSGYTPLGNQMDDAGRYFKGATLRNGNTYTSPIQFACQPNFIILVTDGLQNGSVDVRTEATKRYTTDHSSGYLGMQNVTVHTIGFAIDPADTDAANAVLQTTATNGGGSFFSSADSAGLEVALQNAISQILAATFAFATPVVPTTGTSGVSRAYLALFQSNPTRPFWRGYLKAYSRDANGLIQVDADGIPLDSALVWDAGLQLSTKTPASRKIYTYFSGARQDFATNNSNIINSTLAAASSAEKDKIIKFTLGIDTYDEDADGNTTEDRAWKLGDIFHSTPVLVTPPLMLSTDDTYNTFKTNTTNASRTQILLAGANDGMLHAFKESDGAELWAFIPSEHLDDLKDLTANSGQHDFLVDGSPVAADVKFGSVWKTIVVFGSRRGGKTYHALDITDTTSPQWLWSFTDSKLGESWSEPAIGKIKLADNSTKYVAFIGGGYNTPANNSSGKAFFAVDLSNGQKLWEYSKPASPTDDKQYMNFSLASAPTAVDLNNDGLIDRVYIGDVGGQLWKFDVSAAATVASGLVTNWTGKRLYNGDTSQANPPIAGEYYPAQAIYAPPALSYDSNNSLWVYFGTGDRNHPNNTSANRFYGIRDDTSMANLSALTVTSLTNVTSGTGSINQGWYIVLNSNEKVLAAADVFNKAVFFTSFTPVAAAGCGNGGGNAKLYAVNLTTGDAAINLTTGMALAGGQGALLNARAIGTGIPSRPQIVMNQTGNTGHPYVITGTTNRQITNAPVPSLSTRKLIAWREVF